MVGAEGAVDVFLHEMELKSTVHCDCCDRMKRNKGVWAEGAWFFLGKINGALLLFHWQKIMNEEL